MLYNQQHLGATDPLSLHNLRVHISYSDRYHLHKRTVLAPHPTSYLK